MSKIQLKKIIGAVLLAFLILPGLSITAFAKDTKSKGEVAPPVSSLAEGSYFMEQKVELSSSTPGVSIYYNSMEVCLQKKVFYSLSLLQ
ncbi:chitobiase/beta-hexosaminidase C-terminal domain-containing protein [Neobacillus sp. NPDC093182]|uniref:chitobiase/beta-hexosaminidase C-terminal domain-containing protein n=1 Tax=Neobacillus sp. NPDC093182 TaxID=3364297 RepID=UPI00380E732D